MVKRYSLPTTPCDRVITPEAIGAGTIAALAERRATLDPVALLRTIREALSALASIVSPELGANPRAQGLERFLARPADRRLEEQENAGRKQRVRAPRTWRTRKDPLEGYGARCWARWRKTRDASAVMLLERLQEAEPGRFSRVQLRTLERRVQKWRGIMASKVVYAGSAEVARDTYDLSD